MRGNFTKFSKPTPSIPDSMIEKFLIEKNKRSYQDFKKGFKHAEHGPLLARNRSLPVLGGH
jgi:hypothetical protein